MNAAVLATVCHDRNTEQRSVVRVDVPRGVAARVDAADLRDLLEERADLLAALTRALLDADDPLHIPGCVDNPSDRPCCWIAEARAAIAKARGDR